MTKLWGFINNQSLSESETLTGFAKCNAEGVTTCVVTVNGFSTTYTKYHQEQDINVAKFNSGEALDCLYDRASNTKDCSGYTSSIPAGDYRISDVLGIVAEEDAKS